jgi:proton glutamate symport protein
MFFKKYLPLLLFLAGSIIAILTAINFFHFLAIPPALLTALRWFFLLGIVLYAVNKKSLTTWILVSMLLGAEVGHDFPLFSVNLKVVSQIFLKMIKSIIAPLLFGTLVYGIAGHSDLKQVGRMGW